MQEKFRKSVQYFPQIVNVSNRMLKGAQALHIPVIVTEQYPKGLGPTAAELDVTHCRIFPKTQFSMMIPEVEKHLEQLPEVRSIILCGIETQACVLQTVLDLIDLDYDVHVIADAVSSRTMVERMFALQRIREVGGYVTTSESMLFQLCRDAMHPNFKQIQQLVWEPAPDSGLLGNDSGTPV